jgi:hypothetical protein
MTQKKHDAEMKDELQKGEVLFYMTEDGWLKLDVRLNQQLIAELFLTNLILAKLFFLWQLRIGALL